MNRGVLPGFYFDEAKQKYFKIQANHNVAPGSKYSAANVHKEKRENKRRRATQCHEEIRRRQTVHRSRLLTHPILGGAGLQREIGHLTTPAVLHHGDKALISELRCRRLCVKPCVAFDAFYQANVGKMMVAGVVFESDDDGHFTEPCGREDHGHYACLYQDRTYFYEKIYAYDPSTVDSHQQVYCASAKPLCVSVEDPSDSGRRTLTAGGVRMKEWLVDSHPCAAAYRESRGCVAVRDMTVVHLFGAHGDKQFCVTQDYDAYDDDGRHLCPALDWLDDNTVVFGDNSEPGRRVVTLWDVRTENGAVGRFFLRDRITGLRVPDSSGRRLLISTNRHIYLFDTWKGDKPVMQLRHEHVGPELHFATNQRGLIAAVDSENVVQLYSLWTGGRIGSLPMPDKQNEPRGAPKGLVRKLRWCDADFEGEILTACQGTSVLKWSWHSNGKWTDNNTVERDDE